MISMCFTGGLFAELSCADSC